MVPERVSSKKGYKHQMRNSHQGSKGNREDEGTMPVVIDTEQIQSRRASSPQSGQLHTMDQYFDHDSPPFPRQPPETRTHEPEPNSDTDSDIYESPQVAHESVCDAPRGRSLVAQPDTIVAAGAP